MNGLMIARIFVLSGILSSASSTFAQDRTPLAELTEADHVYINRGHSYAEAVCLTAVMREIEAYGGPEAMREFTINLDDGLPTSIESAPLEIIHTCTGGQQIMRDSTGTSLLQIYDESGEPTLMEP